MSIEICHRSLYHGEFPLDSYIPHLSFSVLKLHHSFVKLDKFLFYQYLHTGVLYQFQICVGNLSKFDKFLFYQFFNFVAQVCVEYKCIATQCIWIILSLYKNVFGCQLFSIDLHLN